MIIDGRHLRRPDVVAVARGRPPVHRDAAERALFEARREDRSLSADLAAAEGLLMRLGHP